MQNLVRVQIRHPFTNETIVQFFIVGVIEFFWIAAARGPPSMFSMQITAGSRAFDGIQNQYP
jgi:hypothetical protein